MFVLLMVAMMVPVQVTIVALYKIMTMLGVINTSWAVTLPSIFGASCPGLAGAFGVFMMRQFFMGVPKELNEAAAIDGEINIGIVSNYCVYIFLERLFYNIYYDQ